jgi:hypothetical protein
MTFSKEDLRNDDIYYGNKSNWQFWSVSWYKKFRECEARALAELKEDWAPTSSPLPLLVGNYVHSYFESYEAHERFKEQNKEELYADATVAQYKEALDDLGVPYKKSAKKDELVAIYDSIEGKKPFLHGKMYKDFEVAERMIARVKDEPFFNFLWQGKKEEPVTGELFGVNWKGKIDLLNVEEGYFVDLKTSQGFDRRYWSTDRNQYVSFVEAFGYVIQVGIYERLLEMEYGKPFTGYIYAVSKEDPANVEAIEIEDFDKDIELRMVEQNIDRLEKVKTGQEAPTSCGKCEYCREHKVLDGFIIPAQLID